MNQERLDLDERLSLKEEVQNFKLHFEVFGERKEDSIPVILIHGWSNSIEVVKPFANVLANYFQVVAIDLPGHGKSGSPSNIWDMEAFANTLKKFLDDQDISKANFIGHSFGGKTIIKFCDLYPEYINQIVLIGASGLRLAPSLQKRVFYLYLKFLRNFIRFKNTKFGQKIYQNWYIPKYASRDYKNAGPLTKTFVKTLNEELELELSRIKKAALLIWGADDDESPKGVGVKMHELIKDSELIIMEGADHFPFLGNGQSLVTRYVRDFFSKKSPDCDA